MWSKQKFQEAFDEYIGSKLFKDGKELFNLSAIQFAIANESNKEELIDFLVRNNVQQNTSFTILDLQSSDFQYPIEDLVHHTIKSGNSIIALDDDSDDNKQIVAHIMCDDFVSKMNIHRRSEQYSVRYKHCGELIDHAKHLFFESHSIDKNNIKFGDYLHSGWGVVDSKYAHTGLAVIIMSFAMAICYKLGYKFIYGTSTTSRTRSTSSRKNSKNQYSLQITTEYDYSEHVFQDGNRIQTALQSYAAKYDVNKDILLDNCAVQVIRSSFMSIKNLEVIENMIRMFWYKFYNKKRQNHKRANL